VSPTAIGLICGLAAACCFGVGDFLVQALTRERGWLPAVLGVQIVSALALVVAAMLWHGPLALGRLDGLVLLLGSINTIGLISLYRAFEVGKLSLVSPIAGTMGVFTLLFAWLAGQVPPTIVLPGLAAVLLGILLASLASAQGHDTRVGRALGVGWALASALAFGWVFFRLGDVADAVGSAWAIFGLRLVAIPWLLLAARLMRVPLRASPDPAIATTPSRARLFAVALLDSSGLIALAVGSVEGSVAIAAVLASAFPVVTILLARVRLHEKLAWWQWIGVAAIVSGVIWISAWRN